MLQSVQDVNGNRVTYNWAKYPHYYGFNGNLDRTMPYDRDATLASVSYGANSVNGALDTSEAQFTYADRCTSGTLTCSVLAGPTTEYPDVPSDLLVACTVASCAGNTSPSFFTTKRLVGVDTRVKNGTVPAGAGDPGTTVDKVAFTYVFPQYGPAVASTAGNPQKMFLSTIQRTSFDKDGLNPFVFDPVRFGDSMTWLANRADLTSGNNVPPTFLPRVSHIVDELGGVRDVAIFSRIRVVWYRLLICR
jgi:hypothetical protein